VIRVYDFRCPRGHVEEHFVDSTVMQNQCACGALAERQIAAPRAKLEGITGAFPGAADKWERDRASHIAKEKKNKADHGTYR